MFTYTEFTYIFESFDEKQDTLMRDYSMEQMAKFSLPEESHDSLRVFYTNDMNDHDLRVIKFNNPRGEVEYHLQNLNHYSHIAPAPSESSRGVLSAMKTIYHDSRKEIESGGKVFLQTLAGSHLHDKIKSIAQRLASKHGRTVIDKGVMPITTAPFLQGPAIVIEHAST